VETGQLAEQLTGGIHNTQDSDRHTHRVRGDLSYLFVPHGTVNGMINLVGHMHVKR
jgi:hypothetical protein